jgi:hypothetical protein
VEMDWERPPRSSMVVPWLVTSTLGVWDGMLENAARALVGTQLHGRGWEFRESFPDQMTPSSDMVTCSFVEEIQ